MSQNWQINPFPYFFIQINDCMEQIDLKYFSKPTGKIFGLNNLITMSCNGEAVSFNLWRQNKVNHIIMKATKRKRCNIIVLHYLKKKSCVLFTKIAI